MRNQARPCFALFFGNRGFFPGKLIAGAREALLAAVRRNGFEAICMDESETRYGAVETPEEGRRFAGFLRAHEGEYQGVILSLPNFGDENGALEALRDVRTPILVQAFPDEAGKMDFENRRDSVCGKLAMCCALREAGIRFLQTESFAVSPDAPDFDRDLKRFAAVCPTKQGMEHFHLGIFGARTTAFKTVRIDEIALHRHGIDTETIDLSTVFAMAEQADAGKLREKQALLASLSDFSAWPPEKLEHISRLAVATDELIEHYSLGAVAYRCWDETEKRYGVAPCLILGELNERGIAAACETDAANAVIMRALTLASGSPVMLLDANNNYGCDGKRCILFHCGPAPRSMMRGPSHIEEHLMFRNSYGAGSGVGINVGGLTTENGRLCALVAEGRVEDGDIESAFFGIKTVFEPKNGSANDLLCHMAANGFRHHLAIARGHCARAVQEALAGYLDYDVTVF